jgi:carboxyl-terminal processing protease
MRFRATLAILLSLIISLIAACGVNPNRRVSRITPPQPAVVLSKSIAGTDQNNCGTVQSNQPLATGSHASTIANAYHDLLSMFVRPLNSADLLTAAWQGAETEIGKENVSDPGVPAPQLSGSSADADWQTFANSYDQLVQATNGKVDQVKMAFSAVSQMADSVNEGHTYFYDPEGYAQLGKEQVLSGGIGVVLNGTKAPFVVEEVVPDGPADQAGVRVGDSIADVDGCDVSNWDSLQLTSHTEGKAGTPVDIVFDRPSTGDYEVDITRERVTFPDVTSRMLPDNIGYIHLYEFPDPTTVLSGGKQLRDTITSLLSSFQQQGATGWVLDLRGDPGGEVTGVQVMAGIVLPPGIIFSSVDRGGNRSETRTIGTRVQQPPLLAVLVDKGSASGAELLAAAIQDYGIAPIVGTQTAGVANEAEVVGIGDRAGLSITITQNYTPHGRPINGNGVTPDITAEQTPQDLAQGTDPPLQAAEQLAPTSTSQGR